MQRQIQTIDWSATAAWIALAVAIISPLITTICNNSHQRKLKKIELQHSILMDQYQKRCKVFEEFFKEATSQIHNLGGNIFQYERMYHELFLYVPSDHWDKLVELNNAILSKNEAQTQKIYLEVTKILAALLQEQQKSIPS